MANKKKAAQGKVPAVKPATSVSAKAKGGKPTLTPAQRRAKAQADQRAQANWQRTKRLLIVVAIAVGVTIVAIVIGVLVNNARQAERDKETEGNTAGQITPPNATKDKSAIISNPAVTNAALTVNLHFDYQCTACASLEAIVGPTLERLAAAGDISLHYNIHTFMDAKQGNTASTRAAMAATCADTVGKFQAYHNVVFANYGSGYSEENLRNGYAIQAGMSGEDLTTFQACVDNKATSQFVRDMNAKNSGILSADFADSKGVWGTPTVIVNGKAASTSRMQTAAQDQAELLDYLKQVAGV